MELLAARIGTTLSYCQPYTPTGKAKIERWFRTMKDQWMAALDMRDFHSLEELRGSLYAFVQQYNQSPILPSVDCPHRTFLFGTGADPQTFRGRHPSKFPSGD